MSSPTEKRFHEVENQARRQRKQQCTAMLLHHSWGSRHLNQGHDPQANPHREGIERTDVGVIPLTWLKRRLVQVHDNGNARHDKQHCHDRRSSRVSVRLEHQAHEAQDQRQV